MHLLLEKFARKKVFEKGINVFEFAVNHFVNKHKY